MYIYIHMHTSVLKSNVRHAFHDIKYIQVYCKA